MVLIVVAMIGLNMSESDLDLNAVCEMSDVEAAQSILDRDAEEHGEHEIQLNELCE